MAKYIWEPLFKTGELESCKAFKYMTHTYRPPPYRNLGKSENFSLISTAAASILCLKCSPTYPVNKNNKSKSRINTW